MCNFIFFAPGNNIYENIPDDLEHDPNYSELSSPPSRTSDSAARYAGHTYSNGGSSGGIGNAGHRNGTGYPPSQRPRLPPPQPPVAPTQTGVTINGMTIAGR